MFKLSDGPFWLDLIPGVRGRFEPITRSMLKRARAAAREAAEKTKDPEAIGEAFSETLMREGLVGWDGLGDSRGKVLAFSPAAKETFLKNPRLYAAVDLAYVAPAIARDAEKNVSAPSPTGTSGARTRAKPTARTAIPAPATPAPTNSTPRKRGRAKGSGS